MMLDFTNTSVEGNKFLSPGDIEILRYWDIELFFRTRMTRIVTDHDPWPPQAAVKSVFN